MGIFADEEPRENVAVCISHAHADHWGLLPLSQPGLTVYASAETRGLIEAQCAWRGIQLPTLRWTEISNGSPFRVGCINVDCHAVNHSVPGALAFSIEGGTTVVYTGDLRFAGRICFYARERGWAKCPGGARGAARRRFWSP
jgi:ribonuclease J